MKKEIKIYTFKTCPYCIKAKKLLEDEGIDYSEIDITDKRDKLKELALETNCSTVPQIFVDNRFIGGCDDLVALYEKGDLNNIFK